MADRLTLLDNHPALTCASSPFQLQQGEPFIAVPGIPLVLTPARESDIPERARMMCSPSVDPWVFSPPKPYTEAHARTRFEEQAKAEREIFTSWADEGVSGLPAGTMRLREEGKKDVFVGEVGIKREDDYTEIEDEAERNEAVQTNLKRKPGDPKIRWTLYFLLNEEFAGRGYTTRVMQHLFATYFGPELLNVHHVISYAFLGNHGSRAIHLKLGFVEKEIDSVKMPEYRGGEMRQEWVFEWKR